MLVCWPSNPCFQAIQGQLPLRATGEIRTDQSLGHYHFRSNDVGWLYALSVFDSNVLECSKYFAASNILDSVWLLHLDCSHEEITWAALGITAHDWSMVDRSLRPGKLQKRGHVNSLPHTEANDDRWVLAVLPLHKQSHHYWS